MRERKAFCVYSVLFASRSGEHLKYAEGGKSSGGQVEPFLAAFIPPASA